MSHTTSKHASPSSDAFQHLSFFPIPIVFKYSLSKFKNENVFFIFHVAVSADCPALVVEIYADACKC